VGVVAINLPFFFLLSELVAALLLLLLLLLLQAKPERIKGMNL
jgi:hypothetical protein